MTQSKKIYPHIKYWYDGIELKSGLEKFCYQKLKEHGFDFKYESESVILMEAFKLKKTIVLMPKKRSGKHKNPSELSQRKSIMKMSYTPDFVVTKGEYKIYIETKGKANEAYPYRKKLFIQQLENRDDGIKYVFIEPHTNKQILETIKYIDEL